MGFQDNLFRNILWMTATALAVAQAAMAQDSTATRDGHGLQEVTVTRRKPGMMRMKGAMNGSVLGRDELFKAACCNLGESFTTNPSVDVSYSDATTGARRIRLLGLSGTYVQMLSENLPDFRGASAPYSLDYVPGPWMKSISVSKGAASVRNGYESVTGQINVEYLKPEDQQGFTVNVYGNTMSRLEANFDGNIHLSKKLSTILLGHFQNDWSHHDGNHDGFLDDPKVRQYNLQNRWAYLGDTYIFHGGVSLINERRQGGQMAHSMPSQEVLSARHPFTTNVTTDRYAAYMKHAFVLSRETGANLAWMTSFSMHQQDARYGHKTYYVNEKGLYSQLMFETTLAKAHNLSAGLSWQHDYLGQLYNLRHDDPSRTRDNEKENTWGGYAQYTLNLDERLVAMAGLRLDHSDAYGTFLTPRFHVKWQANSLLALRASAGKGWRSPHALAEDNYLMASGRRLAIDKPEQEEAWNMGASAALTLPVGKRVLNVNAEYYYTDFQHQMVIDYDSDPSVLHIARLDGKSYSHTWQLDASMDVLKGLNLLAAWRRNVVRETFGGKTMDKPLQSKWKGLLTASYKTPLGLWQADATLQLNGGGRMPTPYETADGSLSWAPRFKAYERLNLQVTRWFRHFSIYVGGENLTGHRQKHPVIDASAPWGDRFDPTLVYGPVSGAMGYVGVRVNFGKL